MVSANKIYEKTYLSITLVFTVSKSPFILIKLWSHFVLILLSKPALPLANAAKPAPISTYKFIRIHVQSIILVDLEHFHLTYVSRSNYTKKKKSSLYRSPVVPFCWEKEWQPREMLLCPGILKRQLINSAIHKHQHYDIHSSDIIINIIQPHKFKMK